MCRRVSRELAAAVAAAATIELCPACLEPENAGLCHSDRCRRAVLPADIRSPLRDAHSGPWRDVAKREPPESAAVRKARRRDERKRARQRARLGVALAGGFARVSRPAA